MASYLTKQRIGMFSRALVSFENQTVKPSLVFVSVCGPYSHLAAYIVEHSLKNTKYKLTIYSERYSQIDQLYMMCKDFERNIPTYITVCDDDDYFYSHRIYTQQIAIEKYYPRRAFKFEAANFHGDFGSFCISLNTYDIFFREIDRKIEAPPDVLLGLLCDPMTIDINLHYRNTDPSLCKNWTDIRSDGTPWYTLTLAETGQKNKTKPDSLVN